MILQPMLLQMQPELFLCDAALLGRDLLGKSTLFLFDPKSYFFRPRDPSKKLWQVLGINFLQFLALESFSKGEL